MKANDFWVHVGISTFAFCLHLPLVVKHLLLRGVDLNTSLFVVGLTGIVVVALLARLLSVVFPAKKAEVDAAPSPSQPSSAVGSIKEWIVKRGVLFALTQAPIFAIVGSSLFLGLAKYSVTVFAIIISFAAFPVWIAYRKSRSDDPDEPVHHLHRFALYALIPMAAFSVARFPTNFLFGMAYWHPWYDFGNALTGQPTNQFTSLLPGSLLYSLQGYSLSMGFYILFKRHSFFNAVLFLCVYLSSVYSFVFPVYGRIGLPSPPVWHATVWWAHFWMAVGAWGMPKFWQKVWPSLRRPVRVASVLTIAVTVASPAAFAVWRAQVWQFPKQHQIDEASFKRATLDAEPGTVTLVSAEGSEARYRFTLRFGPRGYKNYVNRRLALEAKGLEVSGRLMSNGAAIAHCTAHVDHIESPRRFLEAPYEYDAKLKEMDYAEIPVECFGPVAEAQRTAGAPVNLQWSARITLVGDREERVRGFGGASDEIVGQSGARVARVDIRAAASPVTTRQ